MVLNPQKQVKIRVSNDNELSYVDYFTWETPSSGGYFEGNDLKNSNEFTSVEAFSRDPVY